MSPARRSMLTAFGTSVAAAICLVAGVLGSTGPAPAADVNAREVMERNSLATKVIDSVHDAVFTLTNKGGQQRVRKVFGTTKLQPNGVDTMRMVRFVSPPDVKGTVTLLIERSDRDDDMWIYLPALKKVRRLAASNKRDSFVGTDFSFGDVIGHRVDDWNHRVLREEAVDGEPCVVVESTPKSAEVAARTGYSKRLNWVQKKSFVAVRVEYWDEAGQPLKTHTATDVRLVDPARGRWEAMRQEARNAQTGHHTLLRFESFKVDQQVKDEYFTTRYMEREP